VWAFIFDGENLVIAGAEYGDFDRVGFDYARTQFRDIV
jgi:hypothetical protein